MWNRQQLACAVNPLLLNKEINATCKKNTPQQPPCVWLAGPLRRRWALSAAGEKQPSTENLPQGKMKPTCDRWETRLTRQLGFIDFSPLGWIGSIISRTCEPLASGASQNLPCSLSEPRKNPFQSPNYASLMNTFYICHLQRKKLYQRLYSQQLCCRVLFLIDMLRSSEYRSINEWIWPG